MSDGRYPVTSPEASTNFTAASRDPSLSNCSPTSALPFDMLIRFNPCKSLPVQPASAPFNAAAFNRGATSKGRPKLHGAENRQA